MLTSPGYVGRFSTSAGVDLARIRTSSGNISADTWVRVWGGGIAGATGDDQSSIELKIQNRGATSATVYVSVRDSAGDPPSTSDESVFYTESVAPDGILQIRDDIASLYSVHVRATQGVTYQVSGPVDDVAPPEWLQDIIDVAGAPSAAFNFAEKDYRVTSDYVYYDPFTDIPGESSSGGANGTVIDDGVITNATAPRIGRGTGLVVEAAATNLQTYSEDFTNGVWNKEGATITANQIAAPDGETTADLMVENATNGAHQVRSSISLTSGATAHASAFFKAGSRNYAGVQVDNLDGTFYAAIADLTTGEITLSPSSPATAQLQEAGGGWYRIILTFPAGTGANSPDMRLKSADNGTNLSYQGDGVSGVYVWGAQLETGSTASTYTPTEGSAVTRTADSVTLTDLDALGLTSAVLASGYTVYAEVASGTGIFTGISDGSIDEQIRFGFSGANIAYNLRDNASGIFVLTDAATTPSKAAIRVAAGDHALVVNGGAAVTNAASNMPTVDRVNVGFRHFQTEYLNGTIHRLTIFPRALSDAELQALTA